MAESPRLVDGEATSTTADPAGITPSGNLTGCVERALEHLIDPCAQEVDDAPERDAKPRRDRDGGHRALLRRRVGSRARVRARCAKKTVTFPGDG
jgi:hypothetical protein